MGAVPSIATVSERLSRTRSLTNDVSLLRYVSGARRDVLRRMGIRSVRDLLLHVPHRYLDFSRITYIAYADLGSDVTVVGTVDKVALKRPKPKMQIVEVFLLDQTGVLQVAFFGQPWIADQLKRGDTVAVSGRIEFAFGFKQMKSPFYEVLDAGGAGDYARVLPVYSVSEGLSVSWMRRIMAAALADAGDVCDFLPAHIVSDRGLYTYARALREVHFPSTLVSKELARRRLAYDELLCLQLTLLTRQRVVQKGIVATAHVTDGPLRVALLEALPFALSDEQNSAVQDILQDMAAHQIMNRLLLGDVGTGKTAVAAVALAAVADTQTQAAVMAPTSVLARQYAEKIGPLLDAVGIAWELVTGAVGPAERTDATRRIASGEVVVTFGTTAILSEDVRFKNLTLVVVDEQHRFGVDQRGALRRKGPGADLLAMTATPIPRTLALSLYGDVDCSRIRHRPRPGAGITTHCIAPQSLDLAYGAIGAACDAGHQAYVICPLVDAQDDGSGLDDVPEESVSKSATMRSAVQTQHELQERVLRGRCVGLLHGRMSAREKDEVMERFRSGEIDVLVSTTVVEVGVDVPNATVMLVHDADRFGLATLHQLRGRVGRGDVAGIVFLSCAAKKGAPARRRLASLEKTSDGFELAELDLRLRHEGEVLGYRQHGAPVLHISDLAADADLVEMAHVDAKTIARDDDSLSAPEHAALAREVKERFGAYFEEVERT